MKHHIKPQDNSLWVVRGQLEASGVCYDFFVVYLSNLIQKASTMVSFLTCVTEYRDLLFTSV